MDYKANLASHGPNATNELAQTNIRNTQLYYLPKSNVYFACPALRTKGIKHIVTWLEETVRTRIGIKDNAWHFIVLSKTWYVPFGTHKALTSEQYHLQRCNLHYHLYDPSHACHIAEKLGTRLHPKHCAPTANLAICSVSTSDIYEYNHHTLTGSQSRKLNHPHAGTTDKRLQLCLLQQLLPLL